MNARMWGIIGGVALVLALLSPLVLGNSKKIGQLYEAAEALYERSDYHGAIVKYKEALKESKKFGANTETIDKDFNTLVNLKIAQCYYELAEKTSDIRYYQTALTHIREVVLDAQVPKHQEELTYLWAENLYKIGDLNQAKSKFSLLIEKFPNSRWVPEALYAIGDINFKQENYDVVLEVFQQLTENFPNSNWTPKALYTIGNIRYKRQNHNKALNAFQKLIDEFPHSEFKVEAERRISELELLLEDPDILEVQTMYNEARNLKRQGSVQEAFHLFTNLINQFPDSKYVSEVHVQIAEIYLEQKDYVNARIYYEGAMDRIDDETRKTEIYEAYHATYLVPVYPSESSKLEEINPGRYDNSKLEEINQWSSTQVKTLINATRLRVDKRFVDAAREYEAFINTNPPYEEAVYALYWTGRCYHFAASTDATLLAKSVSAFQKLIMDYGDSPNTIEAYYGLILAYSEWAQKPNNESKWDSVLNTFEEANEKFANDKVDLVQQTLRKMKPYKELAKNAIDDYTEKTRKVRYVDQGYLYLGRGELEESEKKARDAISIDNTYRRAHQLLEAITEAYYGRGIAALNQNQYEKAITQFNESIKISAQFKKAFCNLAVAYIELNEYTKAINPLRKAIDIDSEFKEAHFNLGLAYLRLGNYDYARNSAYAALAIDPQYEPANKLLDSMTD